MTPIATVIIPTYKKESAPYLKWCLWSLCRQDLPIEIIIVADGDIDVNSCLPQTRPYPGPEIKMIRPQKERTRFSEKNNIAIKAAHPESKYFLLVNDDAFLTENCIKNMIDASKAYEDKCMVGALSNCDVGPLYLTRLAIPPQLRLNDASEDLMPQWFEYNPYKDHPFYFETTRLYFYNVLIPRLVYEDVGPLEERFQHAFEDTDYAVRARLLKHRLIIAQNAFALHFSGVTSSVMTTNEERSHDANLFFEKHKENTKLVGYF